ncbi:MAG TPA: prolyl oligopeptidase family serine peptidase, partial [Abditibacterium sp.]
VHLVESAPRDQLQPKLKTIDYLKPGDRVEQERVRLFDLQERREVPTSDALFSNQWSIEDMGWNEDGGAYRFLFNQRGHQHLRVLEMSTTGEVRAIVDESSPTFIDYSGKTYSHEVPGKSELIWASERDGWNHLYLYDTKIGAVKNQITKGQWVMREVERVDDASRQIWFRAFGLVPGQDPYYAHLARINFDGSGLTVLTEGDGNHTWKWSPNRRFLLDTFSRVDAAPVTTLRDGATGRSISTLETGEIKPLLDAGWTLPERFEAKGRDGQTSIYGVIVRPSNFDATKKYPVIENIYAGPQDFFVPKSFGTLNRFHELAELGFIVVQIDGMGTNWRSRAFHDVAYKNLKDAGFPDRILWHKAAGATRPWMDLTRVGIYGGSAGGQNALGALLFHGDFYKTAIADCGCHDNRMDKIWWNEQWMGWPVDKSYEDSSNVVHAKNLRGNLLLIVGELDTNVDPASTMQVVAELTKAGKDFDFLNVPGAGHGAGGSEYGRRRQSDFFVRHLLGVNPPSRNDS